MNRVTRAVLLPCLLLSLCSGVASAGKYNPVLSIGDAAPKWDELAGVDDKRHSLDDLESRKIVVVVFTCNSCPYAVDAEDRLIAIHKKYAGQGVSLVAINVNKVEDDLLTAMKARASEKAFPFTYLFDETQKIARDYGAAVTPECFVLDSQRKVRYMGSIDDSPDGQKITLRHLDSAIEALLAGGDPEVSETIPIGCRVRYERQRTSRPAPPAD